MYFLSRLFLLAAVASAIAAAGVVVDRNPGVLSLVGIGAVVVLAVRKSRRVFRDYGSAAWAGAIDLVRAAMLGASSGLILGRVTPPRPDPIRATLALLNPLKRSKTAVLRFLHGFGLRTPDPELVRLSKAIHTSVFAPTGVGKGVSLVVPMLKTCPDSMITLDVKGENARLTARHRASAYGHQIVLLDPFEVVTSRPATLNVLDFIDPADPKSLDECRAIAEALVIKNPQERDPHWSQKAEIFIAGATAAVINFCPPGRRSLQEVASTLADANLFNAAVAMMCESTVWGGLLARLGAEMRHSVEKEREGILSTCNRFLAFLSTLPVVDSTKTSSFNPADVVKGRMSVYLIIPVEYMRSQSGLLRLWVTTLMRTVVKGGVVNRKPVQVLLDEAASLGHLEAIDDMLTIGRGYGIRITAIYQNLSQLKRVFPEGQDQTLLSNTTQIYFGVNDTYTAEEVSKRLGEETIVTTSGGYSAGGSRQMQEEKPGGSYSRSWNHNDNWSQVGRRLLKPEEVCGLDPRIAITFSPVLRRPLWTYLLHYYEEPRLGLSPTWWARCKTAVKAFALSLVLAAVAGTLVIAAVEATTSQSRSSR